jgi:hypothetical protein
MRRKPGIRVQTLLLIFVFHAGFWLNNNIYAQDKTQYLLREVPQTIALNPAITYDCRSYIELPVVSKIGAFYRNNGFSYNQVFEGGTGITGDSISVNVSGLADALGNRNHLRSGTDVNLLGFGLPYQDWFFSFNISNRTSSRLTFNRDIIDARDGNWDISADLPREINIKGTGIHFLNFTKFSAGAGYNIYPGLSVGARVNFVMGSAHLQTRRSNISLLTQESPIQLTGFSDLLVRGSLPVNLGVNSEGYVTSIESNINSIYDIPPYLFSWNPGMSIDAGVIYQYTEKLTLSASIVDLGFIRWRQNISVASQEEEFVFQGFDLNNYLQTGTDTDFLQALRDSINSSFQLSGSSSPYTAMLPVRVFAAADYQWNKNIWIGGVFEGEVLSNRFYPSLTFTAIARPQEWITASLSYSLMDRWLTNLGFSLVLGNGPAQFYFVTDNIPINYVREVETGLLWPYRGRTLNARLGVNIIIHCKQERESRYKSAKWRKSCPTYD